ncbi:hypothetical protein GGD81_000730 [Rhodobium orientis]|uniref:Sulfotransferase family protein n=1 Tax=Rhodobium orientis TaxID=34017 RepID=A0A327JTD1_9HYPH|nr:sulfotransferase family 2 domain-containing protein [Rhodobium orientis]MBB4301713.1 hypothetical protein [Rhodobium orientis]MBK5950516.1 hypothetical protein [Rhodobium orientis]RAI28162.1 hypothetical protein CH339_07385 [Rhodobium orientis]
MTRRAYVDHHQRICVFWSPKSASRTVLSWYAEAFCGINRLSGGKARRLTQIANYDVVRACYLANREGYFSAAFVRHPATRLLSAYLNKFVRAKRRPLTAFCDLVPYAQTAVRQIAALKGERFDEEGYEGISFVDLLDLCEARIKSRDVEPDLNAHWSTQVPFVAPVVKLSYDHVVAVETLADDMAPLVKAFGGTGPTEARNRTALDAGAPGGVPDAPHNSASKTAAADTPSARLAGERLDPSAFLTDAMLARIGEVFAQDFEHLGYDPRAPDRPPAIRTRNKPEIHHDPMREICRRRANRAFGARKLKRFYAERRKRNADNG